MANEYLKRTPTSTGNRKVWTWSGWIKRNKLGKGQYIFNRVYLSSSNFELYYNSNDNLYVADYSGGHRIQLITEQKFRDTSSWQHILLSIDTTSSTASDRVKLYVNGVRITDFSTETYPTINLETQWNNTQEHQFSDSIGGYDILAEMTDVYMVDGQALTPDVFGFYKAGKGYISVGSTQSTDFRPGQWVPKTPRVIKSEIVRRGGFGVNGFYLPMNDSNNFGADFHCAPNSIIKLQENLPQPRCRIDGVGDYTGALRDDPFKQYLVLAVPGVSGGLQNGFGDYSAAIRGSGSNKAITANGNAGVTATASYYGSALGFDGTGDFFSISSSSDFAFGTGDYTIECWVYHTTLTGQQTYFGDTYGNTAGVYFYKLSDNKIGIYYSSNIVTGGSMTLSQWNHVAASRYSGTLTIFINGVAVGVGADTANLTTTEYYIGDNAGTSSGEMFGYIQDLRIYKGVAKYTGGFDVPRPYTPVGIATWRAVPDSPANNFATWNAVQNSMVLVNGNLTCSGSGSGPETYSTVGITTGKWYVEARTNAGSHNHFGVRANSIATYGTSYRLIARDDGNVYGDTSQGQVGTLSSGYASAGSIVAMAIDGNLGQITYYVNGVNVGGPYSIYQYNSSSLPTPYKIYNLSNNGNSLTVNFGQNPSFSGNTTAGTYTDSNNKGLFKYQPPSGFLALCEDNLPTPAIADPGKHFKTVLYTGFAESSRNITGVGFTPDLVWVKRRDGSSADHKLVDSVRDVGFVLESNTTDIEGNETINFTSFADDGFNLGANGATAWNVSGQNYVAWCWKAGAGTTSTNTNGSITSVVSVNQDAGFSIVSYTGNGTAGATVGHGLGRTPAMVIIKCRNEVRSWIVFHRGASPTPNPLSSTTFALGSLSSGCLSLNLANGTFAYIMDGQTNVNGNTYIAYCWAEIEGYSKFGSYVGNGSADGPFVYCGFKPAWVMIKRTDSTGNWVMHDNARNSTNPAKGYLLANSTDIEEAGSDILDFLSNGFKIRNTWTDINASGGTYIFVAYAESPFAYSNSK